jgi:hypothetical protein
MPAYAGIVIPFIKVRIDIFDCEYLAILIPPR